MTELKPCPFCGSTEIYVYEPTVYETGNDASVNCKNPMCGVEVRGCTLEEAIFKWNSRAKDDGLELKPCPFCGCDLEFKRYIRGGLTTIIEYFDIKHPDNGCILSDFNTSYTDYDVLLKQWNRRVG